MNDRLHLKRNTLIVFSSVVISFLFVAVITYAATTISTNINTGGTLTVTGASTLNGNVTLGNAATDVILSTGGFQASSTLLAGGVARFYDTAVLANSSSATTGVEGGIYYDSVSKVIKMYDGSAWFTVGTTTSGLALQSNRLQLGDLDYYMTFGTTTQQGLSALTLEASSTAAIPLTIVGRASQTANLLQVYNAGATELFAIDAVGNASTSDVSVSGYLWVDGYATTTGGNGNIATEGTLTVAGASTLTGTSTITTGAVIGGGYSQGGTGVDINSLGAIWANGDIAVNGNATTTSTGAISTESSLTVAGATTLGGGTAVNSLVFGFCNIPATTIAASSTAYAVCSSATGIDANHKVIVQATSSLPANFIIQAASSTAASTISVQIFNSGIIAGTDTGINSFNFIGIR